MPPRRKFQNIETPESSVARVEEVEVRWLADAPAYPHKPHEVVSLPDDEELVELRRIGWVVDA